MLLRSLIVHWTLIAPVIPAMSCTGVCMYAWTLNPKWSIPCRPCPEKEFCVPQGLRYREHVTHSGLLLVQVPAVFMEPQRLVGWRPLEALHLNTTGYVRNFRIRLSSSQVSILLSLVCLSFLKPLPHSICPAHTKISRTIVCLMAGQRVTVDLCHCLCVCVKGWML